MQSYTSKLNCNESLVCSLCWTILWSWRNNAGLM